MREANGWLVCSGGSLELDGEMVQSDIFYGLPQVIDGKTIVIGCVWQSVSHQ